jgi:predicted AlkP superfamily phosphohydrolase/phosphomutase
MDDHNRVLIIGLDGATFDVLQPLMDSNGLPNLAALQSEGVSSNLLSTVPPMTPTAWTSFMTGVNPGKHSIFNFFERDISGYTYEDTAGFVSAAAIKSPTLWEILSQSGKHVGVVNVPMTYPPRPIRGFMITGMLTPPSATTFTYPPDLRRELRDYRVDLDQTRTESGFDLTTQSEPETLIKDVTALLEHRLAHTLRLVTERPWDLFTVVFVGTDRLFHEFWHYLDPNCRPYYSDRGRKVRRAIEAYLYKLDQAIGVLLEAVGLETMVLIMSDHGFGPAPNRRVNLNDWLKDLGLLSLTSERTAWLTPEYWATRLGLRRPGIKRVLKRLIPREVFRDATIDPQGGREIPADWSRTRAYAVQLYNHICGIEINVKGRKRQGCVETGAEYEGVRDLILEHLETLVDPQTGERVVLQAHRREDLYRGAYVEQVPDIIIELKPDYVGLAPLGNGEIVTPHKMRRQGDHRPEGVLLVSGSYIDSAVAFDSTPHMVDIVPTVLYALGEPIPVEMDGRVLSEIFCSLYTDSHPLRYRDLPLQIQKDKQQQYSMQEMQEVEERLRGLGYLE